MVLDKKVLHGDKREIRAMAARICSDYLQGAWRHVTVDDVTLTRVTGGLSNWLYCVSLNESCAAQPARVLLRLYGQMHGERALDGLVTESVIFTLLSERGLGPELHGVFPGGRLEQYIDARPLLTKELPQYNLDIAGKMAAVHSMRAPITKAPTWLWATMNTWLHVALDNLNNPGRVKRETQAAVARLQTLDLRAEVTWLRHVIDASLCSTAVFSHNDLQCGNILLRDNDKSLVLIDFEYCSYNYRGFDLANHFIEYMYDYTHAQQPFFSVTRHAYPDTDKQLEFIREYLRVRGLHISEQGTDDEMDHILEEVQVFTMVSHLLWGLWACVNAKMSDIPFGYWEYADERLSSYKRQKQQLYP